MRLLRVVWSLATAVRLALVTLVSAKLGSCARCMRLSLRGALWGWAAAGAVHLLWPGTYGEFILAWPVSFTALWFVHIATYGVRRARIMREFVRLPHQPDDARERNRFAYPMMSRRRVLVTFAQAVTAAVLASLSMPVRTGAQSLLPTYGNYCGKGNKCPNGVYGCPPVADSGLDAGCMRHDHCYDLCPAETVPYTALGYTYKREHHGDCVFPASVTEVGFPKRQAHVAGCDQALCSAMKGLAPPSGATGEAERYARWGAWTLFGCRCAQWDISGEWVVKQSNDYLVTFTFSQKGTQLTGKATYRGRNISVTGPFEGTLIGNKVNVLVTWSSRSRGRYKGTVVANYVSDGQTFDEVRPTSTGTWKGEGAARCV